MPRVGQTHKKVSSNTARPPATLKIPTDQHLIITTSGGIFSWDTNGIRRLFKSSKKGILAAREAKDGSQLLAVADKRVVVLHDCKRGREQSWGLDGDQGQVRLLEYAPDAKSLFLSTSLTSAIQCYSINESRLVDPASSHPSPPTVMAISPSSHLMLTASEDPPVVYLQNLTLKTPAMQMHPSASDKAVVAASFHPERPNVFMLAFKDGTLAAYDATRMARRTGVRVDGNPALSTDGRAGEIASFKNLHRITNMRNMFDPQEGALATAIGSKSVSITGAVFLPGYRTRAISVGADGRCRIVDFEAGGRILRTWHAQAPVTSLSVLAVKDASPSKPPITGTRRKSESKMNTTLMGGPTSTNSIIAVGRVDGQVLLFDSLGLKLDTAVVDELGEKIISVEWMKGPSPNAMPSAPVPSSVKKELNGIESPVVAWTGFESHLHPALKVPPAAVFPKPDEPALAISVVAEEDFSATVRRTPGAATKSPVPLLHRSTGMNYLDLFSPVKQTTSPTSRKTHIIPDRPPRVSPRPRISSQIFVGCSSPEPIAKTPKFPKNSPKTPRRVSIHPLDINIASGRKSTPSCRGTPISARRGSPLKASSKKVRKRALSKVTPTTSGSFAGIPAAAQRNGQVLADLRRLGAGEPSNQGRSKSNNHALFAPYMNRTGISDLPRAKQSKVSRPEVQNTQKPCDYAASPDQEETKVQPGAEDQFSDCDIWLTAGSSGCQRKEKQRGRQKRVQERCAHPAETAQNPLQPGKDPRHEPVYQVSRFSPESDTVTVVAPQPQAKGKKAEVLSMSEEAMFSAASHFSPMDGSFLPGSKDMRKLFPRGSSLSPGSSPRHSPKRSPRKQVEVWIDGGSEDADVARNAAPKQDVDDPRKRLADIQPNAVQAIGRDTLRHEAAKQAAFALLGPVQVNKAKALPALPPSTHSVGSLAPKPLQPKASALGMKVDTIQLADEAMHTYDCRSQSCPGCKARDAQVRDLQDEVAKLKAEVLGLRMHIRKTGVSSGGLGLGRRERIAPVRTVPGSRM